MTFFEYEARMHAYRLSSVDEQEKMHMQAWLNHAVTATKEKGKKQVPVYKDFKSFFDYEKQIRNVTGKVKKVNPRVKRLAEIAKLTNERR